MADILVKGLELQDDWELLSINIDRSGKVTQSLDLSCGQIAEAVIVPPHGRLIDADELLKRKGDCYDREGHLLYAVGTGNIMLAPTVIEASEVNR